MEKPRSARTSAVVLAATTKNIQVNGRPIGRPLRTIFVVQHKREARSSRWSLKGGADGCRGDGKAEEQRDESGGK